MIGPVSAELLVSPTEWSGPRWPPPVDEALEAVRKKAPQHYPSRFLVLGCAVASAATCDADLFAAYRVFTEVSALAAPSHARRRGGRRSQRGLAAVNMAPTLVALGHRGASLLALKELDRARQWCGDVDGLAETLRSAATYVVSHLIDLEAVAPLALDGKSLVPQSAAALQRLGWMSAAPVHGTWLGVRTVVENWGLSVPTVPWPDTRVVTVWRADERLWVEDWTLDPLLAEVEAQTLRSGPVP